MNDWEILINQNSRAKILCAGFLPSTLCWSSYSGVENTPSTQQCLVFEMPHSVTRGRSSPLTFLENIRSLNHVLFCLFAESSNLLGFLCHAPTCLQSNSMMKKEVIESKRALRGNKRVNCTHKEPSQIVAFFFFCTSDCFSTLLSAASCGCFSLIFNSAEICESKANLFSLQFSQSWNRAHTGSTYIQWKSSDILQENVAHLQFSTVSTCGIERNKWER